MRRLTQAVQILAVVATVVFLGALFFNGPTVLPSAPAPAAAAQPAVTTVAGAVPAETVAGGAPVATVAGAAPAETTTTAAAVAVAVDAAGVYGNRCASCHSGDGSGGVGPALAGGAVAAKFPNIEDQIAVVRDGRGSMPAFAERLTEDEIRAVVQFTRTL